MNIWPDNKRCAMAQSEHEAWNAKNYPGTRQICEDCADPTGRCEEDSIYTDGGHGPLCVECWRKTPEYLSANAVYTTTDKPGPVA